MKSGQVMKITSSSGDEILDQVEKSGLADFLIKRNNRRCQIAGINFPQSYPLPGFAESVRAFAIRFKNRLGIS